MSSKLPSYKTGYTVDGKRVYVRDIVPVTQDLTKRPQAAIYSPRYDLEMGHYLEYCDANFTSPARTYGDHNKHLNLIFNEFKTRKGATGVLLHGLKGTGKTLLAQELCNLGIKNNLPVLYIPVDHHIDPSLLKFFIKRLGRCVVFMDEFAKNYHDKNDQSKFLNLFCDTELEKVLFIVVDNSKDTFSEFMGDRPSRFLFSIAYDGIPKSLALEMADEAGLSVELMMELADYVEANKVSMDVVNTFIMLAKRCKTDLTKFYEMSSLYNIPAIHGWSICWNVTHSDDEDEYPHVDFIGRVDKQATIVTGKMVIDEVEYPMNYDLTKLPATDTIRFGRVAKSYKLEIGSYKLNIIRFRTADDHCSIDKTAGVVSVNSQQRKKSTSNLTKGNFQQFN